MSLTPVAHERVSVGRRRVLRSQLVENLIKTLLGTVLVGGIFSGAAWFHHTKARHGVAAEGGRHVASVVATFSLAIGFGVGIVFVAFYFWQVYRPRVTNPVE